MKITDLLEKLAELQRGISIDEPVSMRIQDVYDYPPDPEDAIAVPCVINQWRLDLEKRQGNDQRETNYTIRMQVLIAESGADFAAYANAIAAFHEAFMSKLDESIQLDDASLHLRNLRGDTDYFMPVIVDREPKRYLALAYLMDARIKDTAVFGP